MLGRFFLRSRVLSDEVNHEAHAPPTVVFRGVGHWLV